MPTYRCFPPLDGCQRPAATSVLLLPLFLIGLTFATNTSHAGEAQADQRPNIVLIYLDDFGWRDTGFNGSRFYETPNMDRIAAEGINFVNAYSNGPNCAPSRACLMSGQYSPRHGIYTVGNPDRGKSRDRKLIPIANRQVLPAAVPTFPEQLQQAGYATCFLGKWHLGAGPETGPAGQGFDLNFGGLNWGQPRGGYFSPYRNPYLSDGPDGEYLTDRLTAEAIQFIEDQSQSTQPFLVCLSHYAVHTPIQAKADDIERFKRKEPVDEQNNATYAAMIHSVDEGIGRILDKLEQCQVRDNTLVILYSDNGGFGGATNNSPLRGFKGMLYEGGIRVPLAMSWPKVIPPKSVCRTPVIGTDLYPTLVGIAGGQLPQGHELDGQDLLPMMKGEAESRRHPLYWHFPAYLEGKFKGARNDDPVFRTRPAGAIRWGDWKLIEFFEDGGLELYHLAEDPGESRNLADTRTEKRDELHRRLQDWRKQVQAPVPDQLNPEYRSR